MIKTGVNGYQYCKNNPVNRIDPTGKIFKEIATIGLGGLINGAVEMVSSAATQLKENGSINGNELLGAGANGFLQGLSRTSHVVLATNPILGAVIDLGAGVVGKFLEQAISGDSLNLGEALRSGLNNAASNFLYGNTPLKNVGDAFKRGASTGASRGARAVSVALPENMFLKFYSTYRNCPMDSKEIRNPKENPLEKFPR